MNHFPRLLEELSGEPVPFSKEIENADVLIGAGDKALGYSQLNELLLLGGLDRITHEFFGYLINGKPFYTAGMGFESLDELEAGIRRFRIMALLTYGNVKFAFKSLSRDVDLLQADLAKQEPPEMETFLRRHEPILPVQHIPPEDTYLTGYLIGEELNARLDDPEDREAKELAAKRERIVQVALRNHSAYLASDHLDVYVATSMRSRNEFMAIGRTVKQVFDHEALADLKLRWFDPTQAYCQNRIDKGLAEGLMLRRAACTIYLAQESDTLGKDSELASTLAQGKPVIAFVPQIDDSYFLEHIGTLLAADSRKTRREHLLDQLRLFDPGAAWEEAEVRGWCEAPATIVEEKLEQRVKERIKQRYDYRAKTLKETHPLGIQVNLGTGVANGVLVVRSIPDCANLVRILTRSLLFDHRRRPTRPHNHGVQVPRRPQLGRNLYR